jgi:transcriptional regulator with XRE-family HTH domain/DNA-directed RNA polymerase subunit RPC12/RpoP
MDQIKTGKFIQEKRKENNLTQMQLAEMLGITDRAVSKWETGRALPDSSIMLDLCEILKISVNDLLSGEVVTMSNCNEETNNTIIELIKQKEENDRSLLMLEWVVGILSLIILFVPIIIGALLPMEEWQRLIIIFTGFIPAFIGFCFAVRIEQIAGYYECKHCHHRYVPSCKATILAMHMGRTRYMKCPECGKRSWQKKVISKE